MQLGTGKEEEASSSSGHWQKGGCVFECFQLTGRQVSKSYNHMHNPAACAFRFRVETLNPINPKPSSPQPVLCTHVVPISFHQPGEGFGLAAFLADTSSTYTAFQPAIVPRYCKPRNFRELCKCKQPSQPQTQRVNAKEIHLQSKHAQAQSDVEHTRSLQQQQHLDTVTFYRQSDSAP